MAGFPPRAGQTPCRGVMQRVKRRNDQSASSYYTTNDYDEDQHIPDKTQPISPGS